MTEFIDFIDKWYFNRNLNLELDCLWNANYMRIAIKWMFPDDHEKYYIITEERCYHPVLAIQELQDTLKELIVDMVIIAAQFNKELELTSL